MKACFTWCVSFSGGFCVASLEGFTPAFFRNSTVVWDDYRQSPFAREGTVFSWLTGCSPGQAGERYRWPIVYHWSGLVRSKKNGLRASGETDPKRWIVRGEPKHPFGNKSELWQGNRKFMQQKGKPGNRLTWQAVMAQMSLQIDVWNQQVLKTSKEIIWV